MYNLRVALLFATAASIAPAMAGEGNGEPFPSPGVSLTRSITNPVYAHKSQDPFQFYNPGISTTLRNDTALPGKSQEPFPFRSPGGVAALQAPGQDVGSGIASATRKPAAPMPLAQRMAGRQGSHS